MNNCRRCQSPDAPLVYISDAPFPWPFNLCSSCQAVWNGRGIPLSPISTPPPPAGPRSPAGEGVAELNVTPESASV